MRQRVGRVGHRRTRDEIAEALAERLAHDRAARRRRRAGAARAVRRPASGRAHLGADRQRPADARRARRHGATIAPAPRLATFDGGTYLLPTVVLCDSPEHPLANREFLFPFASVVEVPGRDDACRDAMGQTLVVTAHHATIAALLDRLLASPLVDRLNSAPIPTNQIGWDQPHEGNLFEHLYARRAFQQHADAALAAAGGA